MYKILVGLCVVIILLTSGCKSTQQHVADVDVGYVRADDKITAVDDDINAFILPYKKEMDLEMNLVLGQLPEDIKKARPNSNMGNWFCDALLVMANKYSTKNVDVALQNYGGFRIPFLPKGPITKGNVYELMPFDNKLVVLELSAGLTRRLIDQMSNDGGWPISKGLNYKIEYGAASDIKIAGNDLDESKTYRIAMPDYVANGGGDCDFLIAIEQEDTGVFIRDIIIEYLLSLQQEGKEIKIDNAKRIF